MCSDNIDGTGGPAANPRGCVQAVKTLCICPDCAGNLEVKPPGVACTGCGQVYPVENGIARFFPGTGAAQDTVHQLSGLYDRAVQKYRGSPRSCGYATDNAFRHRLNILNRWVDSRALKGRTVLDIGCGTGLMTQVLARHNQVWGVDVSAGLLAQAGQKGISTIQGSALSLPFRDSLFDLVVCMGVIPYYVDPEPIFFHMARVTRPGGKVVVTSTTGSWLIKGVRRIKNMTWKKSRLQRLYSPAEIKSYLTAQGLTQADTCLGFNNRIIPGDRFPVPVAFRALARVAAACGIKPGGSAAGCPGSGCVKPGCEKPGQNKPGPDKSGPDKSGRDKSHG
jgi:ubiquinone/menaquinone biosynthesis C-methylase UbiE